MIVGLGYVGLPLAVLAAQSGFRVVGLDTSEAVLKGLNESESHIPGIESAEVSGLIESGAFTAIHPSEASATFADPQMAAPSTYVVCVPTPLLRDKQGEDAPNLEMVDLALKDVAALVDQSDHPNPLIVVESTTYPGMTAEKAAEILAENEIGRRQVAYSPERVDPAKRDDLLGIPKIVGADQEEARTRALAFYESLGLEVHSVGSTTVAEAVKVIENTFRFVSITFANMRAVRAMQLDGEDARSDIPAARASFGELPPYLNVLADVIDRSEKAPAFPEIVKCLGHEGPNFDECNSCPVGPRFEERRLSPCRLQDIVEVAGPLSSCFRCATALFLEDCLEYFAQEEIDAAAVFRGIATKPFGLGLTNPGPGIGGHCIPVDPLYWLSQAMRRELELPIIDECHQFNSCSIAGRIVNFAFDKLEEHVAAIGGDGSKRPAVVLLGVSFKANVPDVRETPARRIVGQCHQRQSDLEHDLFYYDPTFDRAQERMGKTPEFRATVAGGANHVVPSLSPADLDRLLEGAAPCCVMLLCDHDVFREQQVLARAAANGHLVIDLVGVPECRPTEAGCHTWGISSGANSQAV